MNSHHLWCKGRIFRKDVCNFTDRSNHEDEGHRRPLFCINDGKASFECLCDAWKVIQATFGLVWFPIISNRFHCFWFDGWVRDLTWNPSTPLASEHVGLYWSHSVDVSKGSGSFPWSSSWCQKHWCYESRLLVHRLEQVDPFQGLYSDCCPDEHCGRHSCESFTAIERGSGERSHAAKQAKAKPWETSISKMRYLSAKRRNRSAPYLTRPKDRRGSRSTCGRNSVLLDRWKKWRCFHI